MIAARVRPGMGRSVLAVVGGFLATALLSLGTDAVLHATAVYPGWGQPMADGLFVLATAYRMAFTVLGGLITARWAPRAPMAPCLDPGGDRHRRGHGRRHRNMEPGACVRAALVSVALIVTALPCVWLGGRLATR